MQNRAFEFIAEAYNLLGYPGNDAQARIYVRLALGEVRELLDRIELYDSTDAKLERRIETRQTGGVLIEDARALLPARLVAPQRAALPGNGRHK